MKTYVLIRHGVATGIVTCDEEEILGNKYRESNELFFTAEEVWNEN